MFSVRACTMVQLLGNAGDDEEWCFKTLKSSSLKNLTGCNMDKPQRPESGVGKMLSR